MNFHTKNRAFFYLKKQNKTRTEDKTYPSGQTVANTALFFYDV